MHQYISFLRGINVSGKNMIKMSALLEMFVKEGFLNAKTYIQSGNVVFLSEEKDNAVIEHKITACIKKYFSLEVAVIVKEGKLMQQILTKNPFNDLVKDETDKLYVIFLSEIPSKELIDKIDLTAYLPDQFIIQGDVIYLYCKSGYGNTKLNNNFFEKKLKLTAYCP